jgi:hypothetical protein
MISQSNTRKVLSGKGDLIPITREAILMVVLFEGDQYRRTLAIGS